MDKAERLELIQRKVHVEEMLKTEGWSILKAELGRLREQAILSLLQTVDNHPRMSQHSGRLAVLRTLDDFLDRVIRDGTNALREHNRRGYSDTSEEE